MTDALMFEPCKFCMLRLLGLDAVAGLDVLLSCACCGNRFELLLRASDAVSVDVDVPGHPRKRLLYAGPFRRF